MKFPVRIHSSWAPRSLQFIACIAIVTGSWHLGKAPASPAGDLHLAPLAAAAALYLASHLIRAARVGLLLLFERPSISKLLAVHFSTAWLSAVVPLKLGEAARAAGIATLAKQPAIGLAAYIVEKVLDALFLLLLVTTLAAASNIASIQGLLAAFLLALLVAIGVAYFSLLGLIRDMRFILVAESRSNRTLRLLAGLRFLEQIRDALKGITHSRGVLLLLLTGFVWTLDFAAFFVIANAASGYSGLPDDFLQTLQSMLEPSGDIMTSPYTWLFGICLAVVALPASVALLVIAMRRRVVAHGWRSTMQYRQYDCGEADAPDH